MPHQIEDVLGRNTKRSTEAEKNENQAGTKIDLTKIFNVAKQNSDSVAQPKIIAAINASTINLTSDELKQLEGVQKEWDMQCKIQQEVSFGNSSWCKAANKKGAIILKTSQKIAEIGKEISKIGLSISLLKAHEESQEKIDHKKAYSFHVSFQLALNLAAKGNKKGISELLHAYFDDLSDAKKAKSFPDFVRQLFWKDSKKPEVKEVAEQVAEMAGQMKEQKEETVSKLWAQIACACEV